MPKCLYESRLLFMRKRASGGVFNCEIVSDLPGIMVLQIKGDGAWKLFRHEAGGHRWQRVPPNERGGRVHSSTFTVAVFRDKQESGSVFDESDVEIQATMGHGPGGQHRQRTPLQFAPFTNQLESRCLCRVNAARNPTYETLCRNFAVALKP